MSSIKHIKLSELTGQIEQVVKSAFATKTYWVLAETSGVKYYPQKNYFFFDLIEKQEQTDAIITSIKSSAFGIAINNIRSFENATSQKFESDIQVLVKVSVEYTSKYGLKLNFIDIDHSFTIGNLEKQRQETLKNLLEKNQEHIHFVDGEYITFNQILPINPVIQSIALISSGSAEGYKDFKNVLSSNQFKYRFYIDEYLTQVQGDNAAQQMVKCLVDIFNSRKPYDAVVIVRGGGAPTDFLPFDSYILSRAVARFPIPVITGIGHTGNLCVVDRMAFKATIAPTKAAEAIIAHNRSFEDKIISFQKSISSKTNELIAKHQIDLNQVNTVIISKSKDILSENAQHLAHMNASILNRTNDFLMHHKNRLFPLLHTISQKSSNLVGNNKFLLQQHIFTLQKTTVNLLQAKQYNLNYYINLVKHLSPTNVLKRGYSLVYQNGNIVTDPNSILKGSEITTLLFDTEINSVVKEKKQKNEPKFKL